jgi:uncharacterized membrane protein YphA (DoxX/SURF4 family)
MGLWVVRIGLGVFFLAEAYQKLPWLADGSLLAGRLEEWLTAATPLNRWYLERVTLPGAPIFARLVMLGELATGLAFIFGVWTRLAASLALLMVLNFHYASGTLLTGLRFLTDGHALPVLSGLVALAIGGHRLPLSFRRR